MSVTTDPNLRFRPSDRLIKSLATVPNVPKKLKDLNSDSTLVLSDVKWIYDHARSSDEFSFHTLLTECDMILPEPQYPPRNPQLEARVIKLRAQQANRDYNNMTRNIDQKDVMVSLMSDEPFSVQLKEIKGYLILIFQLVLSVGTSFVAGYLLPYYFYGIADVGKRLLVGIIFGFVVAIADLYFVIRFFLETDGVINVTGKREKVKAS